MNYKKSNKRKRLNQHKNTRKKLNGGNGCGCKSLFQGGSYNVIPLNNHISSKTDPLNDLVSSRTLSSQYKTIGGKRNKTTKKRKSKKIKGGNGYLTQLNNHIDYKLNTFSPFNSLFGYETLPASYKLA
jgi:hypothetical protein